MKMKNKPAGTLRRGVLTLLVLPMLAVLGFAIVATRAQQSTSGHASDFTSVEYYGTAESTAD